VVAPGFLENPEVRRWLNGVEPAWTMLEFNCLERMLRIYFLQQWFNLSDPAVEEALYDSLALRTAHEDRA
jgi:hypothetical protein